MNENDVMPVVNVFHGFRLKNGKCVRARMPRIALVRDADLVEAEPHHQAAQIRIGFAQSQQVIDSRHATAA